MSFYKNIWLLKVVLMFYLSIMVWALVVAACLVTAFVYVLCFNRNALNNGDAKQGFLARLRSKVKSISTIMHSRIIEDVQLRTTAFELAIINSASNESISYAICLPPHRLA